MSKPSEGKLLYHITSINNMPSILENGLMPRRELNEQGTHFMDIADPEIITGRERYKLALSEYVPFHFYVKNPFDGAVCKRYGSENMVIISIQRTLHEKNDFFIIPSHPLDRDDPEIYSYEEGYDKIKWDILDDAQRRDYHNSEIKKACMAECVIPYTIPPEAFSFVYVMNTDAQEAILNMKNSRFIARKLTVAPYMFP